MYVCVFGYHLRSIFRGRMSFWQASDQTSISCMAESTFLAELRNVTFSYGDRVILRDVTLAAVSYTHLTLPTNREV